MLEPTIGRIGPNIKYIKGTDNDAAGALSSLTLISSNVKQSDITGE